MDTTEKWVAGRVYLKHAVGRSRRLVAHALAGTRESAGKYTPGSDAALPGSMMEVKL
jgi:hypothetical protein